MTTHNFIAFTRIKFDRSMDEWHVLAYDAEGNRMKSSDYFTNDREDAEITSKHMTAAFRLRKYGLADK